MVSSFARYACQKFSHKFATNSSKSRDLNLYPLYPQIVRVREIVLIPFSKIYDFIPVSLALDSIAWLRRSAPMINIMVDARKTNRRAASSVGQRNIRPRSDPNGSIFPAGRCQIAAVFVLDAIAEFMRSISSRIESFLQSF